MNITDKILEPGEYYQEVIEKDTIYLHHTAGSHRPDWTIDGWEHDKTRKGGQLAVGTAYVVGGVSTTDGSADFDGRVFRAFDDRYWAHHLGLESFNNKLLNQKSVGIEICNYGPLIRAKDGTFFNYVKKPVPSSMVVELPATWRGYKFWHKYTDRQLAAVRGLMLDIVTRHPKIDIRGGLRLFIHQGVAAFEFNGNANNGVSGVWSHSNVRRDKYDVCPQPQIIKLIESF